MALINDTECHDYLTVPICDACLLLYGDLFLELLQQGA